MASENDAIPNESSSKAAISASKPEISNDTADGAEGNGQATAPTDTASTDEAKPDGPGDGPAVESKPSVQQTSSQARQGDSTSNPALEQDPQAESAAASDTAQTATAAEPQGEQQGPPLDSSAVRVASSARKSSVHVSATSVPSGLADRLSSLSAAAGESLRDMIAKSSVVKTGSGAVKSEGSAGAVKTEDSAGAVEKVSSHATNASAAAESTEPSAQTDTTKGEAGSSPDAIVKEEPQVKQEPPDSSRAETPERAPEEGSSGPLDTRESGLFIPETAADSPEREGQQHPASAPAHRSSTASGRAVKIVKDDQSPSDRRSSSYLYNDWDRTLYEKTGRPPPGEAHWSRDKSGQSGSSPGRASGTEACNHTGTSAQPPSRSTSARRRRLRGHHRPGTSPGGRRTFDMARCQRETQDQFGRRIIYRHCFIEPEFTLRGQRIPVHGARKGSIVAAEDTYTGFAMQMVTPPSEGQLSAEKVQRRARIRKRRRKRKKRSPSGKELLRERMLLEEQRRRLEEEGEKLEEDRIRLQETRLHLEQLEEWWKTEGLLILQRDQIREQEEKLINAVIEEECFRIKEERERLQIEWQFLLERVVRQEKEERRIKEELSVLDEKQEEVVQQEQAGIRRMHEMKAVFDIERRMMEVDRKKLVEEVLTCDAFREAMEDAELGGWETLSEDGRSRSRLSSATGGARTQPEPVDPFANIKDSRLERLLADVIRPPVPAEPAQRSAEPSPPERRRRSSEVVSPEPSCDSAELICSESSQGFVALREDEGGHLPSDESGSPHTRTTRPITARGRPARTTRLTSSGDASARQPAAPPSCTATSEDASTATASASQPTGDRPGEAGEMADVWRRRPTVKPRGDAPSSAVIDDEKEEPGPVGGRAQSSTGARCAAPAVAEAADSTLRVMPPGEREHARSEGYIDPSARRAAAESEQRRASALPRLETRGRTGPSGELEGAATALESGDPQPGVGSGTPRDQLETAKTATGAPETVPSQTPEAALHQTDSSGESGEGASSAIADGASAATSQQSSLRSGSRSGDVGPRRVSFHEGAAAQTPSDAAGSGAEDDGASDIGADSGEREDGGGTADEGGLSEASTDG